MKSLHTTFFFKSSSGDGLYQTLLYDDKTTSCDCKGWTRRVAGDGSRSCKHTRLVEAGLGESEAVRVITHTRAAVRAAFSAKPEGIEEATSRRFDFTQ